MIDFLQHAYILIWLMLWFGIYYFAYDSETSFLWNLVLFIIMGLLFTIWPISTLFLWGWSKAKEHPYQL